ncbi:MAG: AAA family ATPase [Gemmatimonadetes bacterium]|nr:AAA family ATPase [Gemmatimonadota bacterium]
MIRRNLAVVLRESASYYPVVTLTGPRQSGKTTLCKAVFPDFHYVSLEDIGARGYAEDDPRGFLREHSAGVVIDEVQRVPELLSALQVEVDAKPDPPGRFILTGSQHFGVSAAVAQSLAGRTAVLTLLPPSLDELKRFASPSNDDLIEMLWTGAYPRIHDRRIPAGRWLRDYIGTYVQRDVREVLNVGDLTAFTTFTKLCAGRTGSELNLSNLAGDAGITRNTAKAWLSVLETSYLCTLIPAWHANLRKQLVKRPKLHFYDTGLVCALLGISSSDQLRHHPLRGPIFESWVIAEITKARLHAGRAPGAHHFRESRGLEVDGVIDEGSALVLVEAKSGATLRSEHFRPLARLSELLRQRDDSRGIQAVLVHGGDERQRRSAGLALPWSGIEHGPWVEG